MVMIGWSVARDLTHDPPRVEIERFFAALRMTTLFVRWLGFEMMVSVAMACPSKNFLGIS
jgi:hypothetical protein